MRKNSSRTRVWALLVVLASMLVSCSNDSNSEYWGKVEIPKDNTLRYISGSEPESLDPPIPTGQPEARLVMGLFDRLVEYDAKTLEPIPELATSWEAAPDGLSYTFYLRKNGKFSNGDPIRAQDFEWSIKRALKPETASRYAFIGYEIKYAEAFNSGAAFVKKNGKFLLAKDFAEGAEGVSDGIDSCALDAENCVVVPADEEARADAVKENTKLKAAINGAEFVPVTAENVGVQALDDYTIKFTLKQPAPYFVGMLPHQFFSVVHRPTIEKWGKEWTKPEHIVTSGPFTLKEWKPYDQLTFVKDPNNWDVANVKLDAIEFYPMDEATTMMNIYKSGRVDALYNHTVPAAWYEYIKDYKAEYMLYPEVSIEYYTFSVKKPPVDNVDVRRAFSLAIDRDALEKYRKTVKKFADFVPGIFPRYDEIKKGVFEELAKKDGLTPEDIKKRLFDPQRACELMAKAGYTVKPGANGRCKVTDFPADKITLSYNTAESNKAVAEFAQAQWRQNLGITVQLKNMEWKTYLSYRSDVEYTGMARAGWVGDFMDPYAFLSQFYSKGNDSSTGWWDEKYDRMLDDANRDLDPKSRLRKMAEAEYYLLNDQPVIPLVMQGTSWMKKPYVKGMFPNPGTLHPWKFVYIEHDRAKWDKDAKDIFTNPDPIYDKQIADLKKSQIDFVAAKKAGSKPADETKTSANTNSK
ncbi:MAG: peptide ABC transporter substrate-binding protein [Pyrinomonadaceae bacterium]